jgi:L-fuculose-phosphate aldolase
VLAERDLKRRIAELSRHAYERGYIGPGDGNISARLGRDRIAVTPSGVHKGRLREEDILIVTLAGETLSGRGRKTSEYLMHELCYRERPDVFAVVHAHPKFATALALAGVSLAQCILSESCITLGGILTAPYSTPTTDEVPNTLRPLIRQTNAIILNRHGALTLGRTLDEAYDRLEIVEHSAQITHAARVIGPVAPLPEAEVRKLGEIARHFGIPQPPEPCAACNACPNGHGGPVPLLPHGAHATGGDAETEQIVAAVLARLRPSG